MEQRWRVLRKEFTDDGEKVSVWADHYPNEHSVQMECEGRNEMPHGKPKRPDLVTGPGDHFHPPDVFTYESI